MVYIKIVLMMLWWHIGNNENECDYDDDDDDDENSDENDDDNCDLDKDDLMQDNDDDTLVINIRYSSGGATAPFDSHLVVECLNGNVYHRIIYFDMFAS